MTQATEMDIRRTILAHPNFTPVEVAPAHASPGFLSRPHVLEAAAACFDELGYDKLTIRTIAGRLGCSVGSIYRYFTDKRELLLGCCSQVLEPVADTLENDQATFDASVAMYLKQAKAMNEQYRLMFWVCSEPRKLPVLSRILHAWAALLGSEEEAHRRWAQLHGMLVIGDDTDLIAAAVTQKSHASPARPVPVPAMNEPPAHEPDEAEDVTLL